MSGICLPPEERVRGAVTVCGVKRATLYKGFRPPPIRDVFFEKQVDFRETPHSSAANAGPAGGIAKGRARQEASEARTTRAQFIKALDCLFRQLFRGEFAAERGIPHGQCQSRKRRSGIGSLDRRHPCQSDG